MIATEDDVVWACCEHCATPRFPMGNGNGHTDPCPKCQMESRPAPPGRATDPPGQEPT